MGLVSKRCLQIFPFNYSQLILQISCNTMLPPLGASGLQHKVEDPSERKNTLQAKATLLMRTTDISSLLWPFRLTTKAARKAHDQRLAAKEHLLLKTVHHQATEEHTWEEIHICVCLLSL